MIPLTRLNGQPLYINCDLIKYLEASPDSTLALITGEKVLVRESCETLAARIAEYRAMLLRSAWPETRGVLAATAALGVAGSPLTAEEAERHKQ